MSTRTSQVSATLEREWYRAPPPRTVVARPRVRPPAELTRTDKVAPGRAVALSIPPRPELTVEALEWGGATPGFVAGESEDAARVAAERYGDASLTALLVPAPGGFVVRPGALSPAQRRAYEAALLHRIAEAEHTIADAQPDVREMQARLLEALEDLPHPDAQERLLDAVGPRLGTTDLLGVLAPPDGPSTREILAELLSTQARFGPVDPDIAESATQRLLSWMDGGEAGSRLASQLLAEAPRNAQVSLLRGIASHYQTRTDFVLVSRFGEPTPVHMLARFFESLTEPDRTGALESLQSNGVFGPEEVAYFEAGRPAAARRAPMLTYWATVATEDYAKWAEAGSSWAWLGGSLSGAATPEMAVTTITTLATLGFGTSAGVVLARAFPRLAGVLGVAGTLHAAQATAIDVQAVLTDTDPATGAPLTEGARLGHLLAAGSGVLLTAAGGLIAFKAGRLVDHRSKVSAQEVVDLSRTHVHMRLDGQDVFVPKAQVRPRPGYAPPPPPAAAPLNRNSPVPHAGPAPVNPQQLKQVANEVVGTKLKELLARVDLGLRTPAIRQALGNVLRAHGTAAYLEARRDGVPHRAAMGIAHDRAKAAADPLVERFTNEAVALELETRIQDGTIFDRSKMSPDALARLQAYRDGNIGLATRALARRLGKATASEVRQIMDAEVAAGRATRMDVQLPAPKQIMTMWETTDGAIVRLKPAGDNQRPGPTVAVELKIQPSSPDSGQGGVAFKLDQQGRPMPKNDYEAATSFPGSQRQTNLFSDRTMDAVHWSVER